MKKLLIVFSILFSFFIFSKSANAYVRVDASFGTFDPVQNSNVNSGTISNVWINGTYPVLENEPWLLSFDQFFYLGSANGTYLNVNADYYVAFNTPAGYTSYLHSARNTLTSSNLRCGIGGYRNGYDSSYIPEVSNFEVTEVSSSLSSGFGTNYLYHIKFNYSQQIRKVLLNNQNASCWFEIPTNYLVGQLKGSNLTYNVAFWSNTVSLQSAVSDNPLASYLGDITNQNNTMINQNQTIINQNTQTNQNLKDINDTLNDDTPPSADISALGNVQGLLPPGPVDSLLNIPTQFLSVVTSSLGGQCKPLSGKWVYDQSLTFPCFNEIIWDDFEDDTLLKFLELIPCAFILVKYFKHLYKKVDRATSMNSNSDDEWGVI